MLGFEEDVVRLFNFISPAVERMLHGALEWSRLCISGAILVWTLARGGSGSSATSPSPTPSAGGLMWLVARSCSIATTRRIVVNEIAQRAGLSGCHHQRRDRLRPVRGGLRRARPVRVERAGAARVRSPSPSSCCVRFIVGYYLPGNVVVSIPFGAAIGAGVLLAFGPSRPPPDDGRDRVRRSRNAGLPVRGLHAGHRRRPGLDAVLRDASRTARASSSRCSASPSERPT